MTCPVTWRHQEARGTPKRAGSRARGAPELVVLVIAETLRSIADGFEADTPDE
jgi:hypothetical protein